MDLSIIIVNFNKAQILDNCLKSIYKNIKNIEFEIIVVDNNSQDDSVRTVRVKYPAIKLIENKENIGFARANNQGLKLYKGRYALLLNNDTEIINDALQKMIAYMDQNKAIGILGPKLLNQDRSIQRQGSILSRRFWLSKRPLEVSFLTGACMLIRREALDKVGLMDERFFFYNEDLDLCTRMKKAGWKLIYCPDASIIHIGGSREFPGKKAFIEGYRGGLVYCKKHYPYFYHLYRILVIIEIAIRFVLMLLLYPIKPREMKERFFALKDVLIMAFLNSI